jgi:4a-hydroxytetrahydrobiopterin dehydratase
VPNGEPRFNLKASFEEVRVMELATRKCVPCSRGTPRLAAEEAAALVGQLAPGWTVTDEGTRLRRHFRFRDFAGAMGFVKALAALAEAEQHHPDFCVHYREVDVVLYTHVIGGLSDNDFVLAAKVDRL